MKKITLLLVLLTTIAFAQDKRTLELGEFTSIKVFTGLKIQLIQSSEQKIVISGKNQRYIMVKNKNGHLSIRLKLTESLRKYDFDIKLYTNRNIELIDVNEGAGVFSDDTISQLKITLKAQEGAFIQLPLDVKYLKTKINSGSNIQTSGKAKSQDVYVGQGGVYDAYNLSTEQTIIVVATGGKAEINVSGILDASVRLGGNVYYKGNPDVKKSRKFIGGVIKYKE
jgi:putative autotransporter adhesin-like protein